MVQGCLKVTIKINKRRLTNMEKFKVKNPTNITLQGTRTFVISDYCLNEAYNGGTNRTTPKTKKTKRY